MTNKKYAVQVPFDKDDWLYVTTEHPNGIPGDRLVVTYNTQEEATEAGKVWNKYRVVMFEEDTNKTKEV